MDMRMYLYIFMFAPFGSLLKPPTIHETKVDACAIQHIMLVRYTLYPFCVLCFASYIRRLLCVVVAHSTSCVTSLFVFVEYPPTLI